MRLLRVLPFAKQLISETVLPGDIVVDATAGNGHDTLFLAQLVGENGHVYAFDIQEKALKATANRLDHLEDRVTLILDSHERIDEYIQKEIGGAMFNLGYLPHGDDLTIITKPESTIQAIQKILTRLKINGIITIAVYEGHEGGANERDALLNFVKLLHPADVQVIRYESINQQNRPPFLIVLQKIRELVNN